MKVHEVVWLLMFMLALLSGIAGIDERKRCYANGGVEIVSGYYGDYKECK